MSYIQFFVFLQVMDFLTTLAGFKFGAAEASPLIRWMMSWGPAAGVAASKVLALGLAGVCISMNRQYLIRWISYWYAGVVVWNVCIILAAGRPVI